jgi:hypothetical protein
MRRVAVVAGIVFAALWIAAPAQAFAHNNVHNPTFHAILDGLTLAVVAAPVVSALLWRGGNRWLLAGLVGLVQVPVAVIGFVPIINPWLHLSLFVLALALTAGSVYFTRRAPHTAPAPAKSR